MTDLPHFSAVIFDLDGLVLDTESTYFAAWQHAATQMGYEGSEPFWQSLSGLHAAAIEQHLHHHFGPLFNYPYFTALSGQRWQAIVEQQGIVIKAGFLQVLALLEAQKIPFALATNSPLSNARECLALAKLPDVFSLITAREQVEHGKPAPDIFFKTAVQLQTPIHECLVLEDSYAGVLGATRAGAPVIYIPSNPINPAASTLATCQLTSLTQLADRLASTLN